MKTLIKILIAVAIINAAGRVGMAAAGYYELKDKSQELITFGGRMAPLDLQDRILAAASDLEVPLQPEDLEVSREGLQTTAIASYTQPVELFPTYSYPINFRFAVKGLAMSGLVAEPASLRH